MLKIRELRIEDGLTQKELAEKIGAAWYNVGDWERGKAEPSVRDLIRLADAFGISIDELVGRKSLSSAHADAGLNEREKGMLSVFRGLERKEQDFIFECLRYASLANPNKK